MGKIHRYYSKEDMKLLECAGKLLEAGISLEDIKGVLPEILQVKEKKIKVKGEVVAEEVEVTQENRHDTGLDMKKISEVKDEVEEEMSTEETTHEAAGRIPCDKVEEAGDIIEKFEKLLISNNGRLEEGVTQMVTESLKKEISYLLLAKDQVEEERYKRLDTLIRHQQVFRKECGKRSVGGFMKEVLGFTG